MNAHESKEWRQLPLSARLATDELDLVRWIGSRLSRLLLGRYEDLPHIERTDELGILANMVARIARELRRSRERDEARRKELEARGQELLARVQELEEARAVQSQLLDVVRELSTPVLKVAAGVLLIPIAGALDKNLLEQAETRALTRVSEVGARYVILDMTGTKVIEAETAHGLVRIARSVSLLGARVVLCGVSAAAARTAVEQGLDFAPALLRSDLASALETALALSNSLSAKKGSPRQERR